jgi:hypothetical protein
LYGDPDILLSPDTLLSPTKGGALSRAHGRPTIKFCFKDFCGFGGEEGNFEFGAGLGVAPGAVFALCGNYWELLVVAVVGVLV